MSDSAGLGRVVYRPIASVVTGALVLVIAAYLLFDTVRRGEGAGAWALAAGLTLGGLIVWVSSVRPAVVADPTQMIIRNPLREFEVPWSLIDDVRLRFQLDVCVDDATYHAWAVPVSTRGRMRERRRQLQRSDIEAKMGSQAAQYAGQGAATATFAERTLAELTLIWTQRRDGGEADMSVTARWAWPYLVAMLAAAVVLIVALSLR